MGLGNLLKALGRLDEAKVKCACHNPRLPVIFSWTDKKKITEKMCNQIGKSQFVYFYTPGKKVSNLKPEFAKKGLGLDQILIASSKKVTYNFGEEAKKTKKSVGLSVENA